MTYMQCQPIAAYLRGMHYQPGTGPIAPTPGYGSPTFDGPPPRRRSSARLSAVVLGVFVTLMIVLAATVGAGTLFAIPAHADTSSCAGQTILAAQSGGPDCYFLWMADKHRFTAPAAIMIADARRTCEILDEGYTKGYATNAYRYANPALSVGQAASFVGSAEYAYCQWHAPEAW